MSEMTPYILLCEVMKQGQGFEERYELKIATSIQEHYRLDEILNSELKKLGYFFMYSGEAKLIYDHLQEAPLYDQEAIDLCNQLNSDNIIACQEIRLISTSKQVVHEKDLLIICDEKVSVLPDQNEMAIWERSWISPELNQLLFAPKESAEQELRTYLVIDADNYTEINGIFNLDQIDDIPIKCMFKGQTSLELRSNAPYLIDMTLSNYALSGNNKVSRFHINYFKNHWPQGNGVFIRTSDSFDTVYDHLRKFNRIQNANGKWFYLKYYHSNFLRSILQSLNLGQLKSVFKRVDSFYSLDPVTQINCHKFSCKIEHIAEKSSPIIYSEKLQEALKQATYLAQSKVLFKDLNIDSTEIDAFTEITTKLLWKNIDQPHHVLKLYQLILKANEKLKQEVWLFLDEVDYSPGYKIMLIEQKLNKQGCL